MAKTEPITISVRVIEEAEEIRTARQGGFDFAISMVVAGLDGRIHATVDPARREAFLDVRRDITDWIASREVK